MAQTKREEIYDAQISPLMAEVIRVCREHDIPFVFTAQLNDDREGDSDLDENGDPLGPFFCTTIIVPEDGAEKLKRAAAILKPAPPPQWSAFVEFADGRRMKVAGSDN